MSGRGGRFFAILLMLLVFAGVIGLLALGGVDVVGGELGVRDVRLMVWSPAEDQSQDSGMWLQRCCEAFARQHPEWNMTFVYGVADEPTAGDAVSQDPDASADVFMTANDKIVNMTEAQAMARFGGKYEQQIRDSNSEALVQSVTMDGNLYAIPYTTNTWFMYYDKRVFTEEDVRSLDRMLEKGVVAFPFTNSWYLPSFYFANGCTLFGDGMQAELGADFSGEKAVEVTHYLIDLLNHPNFVVDQDGSGMAGLRSGTVHAIFSGAWDSASVKGILGEHMGAAALPTFNLNGEEKQMYAYAGSKAIGVNSHCKDMVPAVELALYLAGAEAQALHFRLRNVIPCNTELLEDPAVAADPVVAAQNDTFDRTSVLQPFIAEMSRCWTPVENMGRTIRNGATTHENAQQQTEAMNAAMNSDGLS